MPPFGLGLQPATGAARPARATASLDGVHRPPLGQGPARGSTTLRAAHGLAPLDDFFDQIHRARRILVLTSADFDFPAELPDNVRYVGPVLDDPAWAATPWTAPPGDDPLVLVALSSTFQDHAGCLQRIVDALGTLPVRGLVTTGPAARPGDDHRAGQRQRRAPPPRTPRCCARAAAVVTHGGHGTVVRALAADVPLVVLHHGRDQADNAARLTARGAGLTVKRTASPDGDRQGGPPAARRPVVPHRRRAARRAPIRRDAASGALVAELEDLPAAQTPERTVAVTR